MSVLLGGKAQVEGGGGGGGPCVYMPTSPYDRVVSVDLDSGRPMQSAAKCPFLLTFNVQRFEGPDAALRDLVKLERRRKLVRLVCVVACVWFTPLTGCGARPSQHGGSPRRTTTAGSRVASRQSNTAWSA